MGSVLKRSRGRGGLAATLAIALILPSCAAVEQAIADQQSAAARQNAMDEINREQQERDATQAQAQEQERERMEARAKAEAAARTEAQAQADAKARADTQAKAEAEAQAAQEAAKEEAWARAHPKEAKRKEEREAREQEREERDIQRRGLSFSLCKEQKIERQRLGEVREIQRDARIAGVVSLSDLHDAQTGVAIARWVEGQYRVRLRDMGVSPIRCGAKVLEDVEGGEEIDEQEYWSRNLEQN